MWTMVSALHGFPRGSFPALSTFRVATVLVLLWSSVQAVLASSADSTLPRSAKPNSDLFHRRQLENATSADAQGGKKLTPKVFIISQYSDEVTTWREENSKFDVFAQNITFPGADPVFPYIYCTSSADICLVTVGEGEINAALSIANLINFNLFDLRKTYWLIGGVAGMNPKRGTVGGVTFARFAVQVALQYEIDSREIPTSWGAGYIPLGSTAPDQYPQSIYGTEVFEVSDELRQVALEYGKKATLNDTEEAKAFRQSYWAGLPGFEKGAADPSIELCDTTTGDTWFSGKYLSEAFENTTLLFTQGKGTYCTTQEEDNATLAGLLRGTALKKVSYNRVIILRTGSDFDRPSPQTAPPADASVATTATDNLFFGWGGYVPAVQNIGIVGGEVVRGIVADWAAKFENAEWEGGGLGVTLPGDTGGGARRSLRNRGVRRV